MTTHTDHLAIRPGITTQLEIRAVVQRPGAARRMREVQLRCDAATASTVALNLRGPRAGWWQLDRDQLTRVLTGAPVSTDQPALMEVTAALDGTKVVVARRSRAGVTTVWLPIHSVDFFLDCCDQRLDQGAPAATAQDPR